jgi:hypothetical protein
MTRPIRTILLDAASDVLWVLLERREPLVATTKTFTGDQLARPGRQPRRKTVAEHDLRSDRWLLIDADFKGRLSGKEADADVEFTTDDPDAVGSLILDRDQMLPVMGQAEFDSLVGSNDRSLALFVADPGEAGIVTVQWRTTDQDTVLMDSVTIRVAGEGVAFAGTNLSEGDQQPPETPFA